MRRLAGPRTALTAAALAALYPGLWINDGVLMAESLAALAVAVVLVVAYRLLTRPTLLGAVNLGLLVGVATLVRSELALLWLFVVAPVLVAMTGVLRQQRVLWGAASLVAVALPIAAMGYLQQHAVFERPVLLSTNGGPTIAGANCDDTYFGRGIGFGATTARPPIFRRETPRPCRPTCGGARPTMRVITSPACRW